MSLSWPAPAKLNLFLHITGRRADGYHELQTLFQFLDIGDELDFALRDDGRINALTHLPGLAPEQDLTVRAARLLQAYTGCRQGVNIRLHKRLPLGGGFGGGSSDAATVLVALNQLWQTRLTATELSALALQLGADVPVFVGGRAAWAEGVGECLTPVDLSEPWYVVVAPAVQVSTAALFADGQLTRNLPAIKIRDFFANQTRNVFEPLARARYPEIAAALDWLNGHGAARLTGTGSGVFAAQPNEAAARAVLARMPEAWRGFVARGLNTSPLLTRLEREQGQDTR